VLVVAGETTILVTELGQEEESVTRLSWFDNLVGHLQVDLKLGKTGNRSAVELPMLLQTQ
jgi:hypothetical protein